MAVSIPNPVESLDPNALLAQVITTLLIWGGAIALLFIIFGGFRYIISLGNPESVEKARSTVLYAVLGLILIFLAYLIVAYVLNNLLGVSAAYRLG
jgi:succinate dehydrogenase/fumarate reductase cytochrome b subunit